MNGRVCILYGLGEGAVIGKNLLKKLRECGFEMTTDASQADFIIAHSGGIFFIPKIYKAKVFLFVGVNNGFTEPMFYLQYRKLKLDFEHTLKNNLFLPWLWKSFWNVVYILGKLNRTIYMWKMAHRQERFIPIIKHSKVIIITYKDDPWSGHLTKNDLEKFPKYELITRIGIHDDLWINPDYYVGILLAAQK